MSIGNRTDEVQRAAARALDATMDALFKIAPDATNEKLGETCGVSEARVRVWRSVGSETDLKSAPSTAAMVGCSWEIFEEWVARIREARLAIHGAPAGMTPEAALAEAARADLEAARESFTALADGVLTPGECPAVLAARAKAEARWAVATPAIQRRGQRG